MGTTAFHGIMQHNDVLAECENGRVEAADETVYRLLGYRPASFKQCSATIRIKEYGKESFNRQCSRYTKDPSGLCVWHRRSKTRKEA